MLSMSKRWPHNSGAHFRSCWCVKYVWSVLVGRLAQTARHFTPEKAFFRRIKSVCVWEFACLCMCVVQWTRFEGLCPRKWVSVGENAEASGSHLLEQNRWAYFPMADPRTKTFMCILYAYCCFCTLQQLVYHHCWKNKSNSGALGLKVSMKTYIRYKYVTDLILRLGASKFDSFINFTIFQSLIWP